MSAYCESHKDSFEICRWIGQTKTIGFKLTIPDLVIFLKQSDYTFWNWLLICFLSPKCEAKWQSNSEDSLVSMNFWWTSQHEKLISSARSSYFDGSFSRSERWKFHGMSSEHRNKIVNRKDDILWIIWTHINSYFPWKSHRNIFLIT